MRGELAGEGAAGEEEDEGDGDVRGVEDVAVEVGEDEGDGEEDGVAGLVGGEAMVVRKGDGVWEGSVLVGRSEVRGDRWEWLLALDACGECKDQEFDLGEEGRGHRLEEMLLGF